MEDFPILFLFLIIYLVAASSGKNKPKKQSPMRSRAQGEQPDVHARGRSPQTQEGFAAAFAAQAVHEPCDPRQMHLHEVASAQMNEAQEGEDPCHVGGAQLQATMEAEAAWDEEARRALEQDVLRGVIMSEILMRPDERRALQRKRYHG